MAKKKDANEITNRKNTICWEKRFGYRGKTLFLGNKKCVFYRKSLIISLILQTFGGNIFPSFWRSSVPFFASKQIGIFNANFTTTSFSNCWQIVLTVKELLLALHKTAVFGNMFELNLKLEWVDFCSEKADSN